MKKLIWSLLLLASMPLGAHAQQGIFLDIEDIPGEATQAGFEDQIELFNWSQTVANVGGPPVIMPLQFEHRVDTSTPLLIQAALMNTNLGEVVLSSTRLGGAGIPESYLTVTLDNARVAAVETASDAQTFAREKITLTCSTFTLAYRPQSNTGALENPIVVQGSCE